MKKRDFGWLVSLPFYAVHVAAVVGVALMGFSWKGVALALALYYVRMFGVTGGYHRYFSHRTYRTSRAFQFVLAFLAQSSVQKGALWWAAHHRDHHKYSDTPKDPHSYRDYGFWYSHVGWILSSETEETDYSTHLRPRALPRAPLAQQVARGAGRRRSPSRSSSSAAGTRSCGASSSRRRCSGTARSRSTRSRICWGKRRYATTDDSKNNPVLALVTMGEGWHNNHHYYPRSVRQGFCWWQIDMTYYVLRALALVGIVWDLHVPSQKVIDGDLAVAAPKKPARAVAAPVPATDGVLAGISSPSLADAE